MAKSTLVEQDMASGAELVAALDQARIRVQAALWLYLPEEATWRFFVATPLAETGGPRSAYAKIQEVLKTLPNSNMSLSEISAVSPKDPLIKLLRRAIHTGAGISGIRFSRNVIDGQFIEDAYIYRVA